MDRRKNRIYKYSIRRLSIGVVSVVVGAFTILGISGVNGHVNYGTGVVFAETVKNEQHTITVVRSTGEVNVYLDKKYITDRKNKTVKLILSKGKDNIEYDLINNKEYGNPRSFTKNVDDKYLDGTYDFEVIITINSKKQTFIVKGKKLNVNLFREPLIKKEETQSTSPAPTTPKEPAPTTPKEPAPTTPKEPAPTTPKEPAPTTPKEPAKPDPQEAEVIKQREDLRNKINESNLPKFNKLLFNQYINDIKDLKGINNLNKTVDEKIREVEEEILIKKINSTKLSQPSKAKLTHMVKTVESIDGLKNLFNIIDSEYKKEIISKIEKSELPEGKKELLKKYVSETDKTEGLNNLFDKIDSQILKDKIEKKKKEAIKKIDESKLPEGQKKILKQMVKESEGLEGINNVIESIGKKIIENERKELVEKDDKALVTFSFKSDTKDKELPKSSLPKLPSSYYEYVGKIASWTTTYDEIKDGNGVWKFKGWNAPIVEPNKENKVIGSWEFLEIKPQKTKYTLKIKEVDKEDKVISILKEEKGLTAEQLNEKTEKFVDGAEYKDETGNYQIIGTVKIDGTTAVVKAIEVLRVKFDSNGGSQVPSVVVKKGNEVTKPEVPTKKGFKFERWELNGKEYRFTDEVKNDITLKAVWSKDAMKLTPAMPIKSNEKIKPHLLTEKSVKYVKKSMKEIVIRTNAELSSFMEIRLGGKVLDRSKYEVKAGSTEVKLSKEYLESLPLGKYLMEVVSKETEKYDASTLKITLTVVEEKVEDQQKGQEKPKSPENTEKPKSSENKENPNTEDLGVMTSAMTAIVAGAALVATKKKKD